MLASDLRITTVGVGRRDDLAVDDTVEVVVAVDQQVVPVGVAEHLVLDRRPRRARLSEMSCAAGGGPIAVAAGGRINAARPAPLSSASLNVIDTGGVITERTLSTPRICSVRAFSSVEIVALDQVGDIGAIVGRREQQDDGLAAEAVLELDVVERDLGVGVEIAVLPGGELDPSRPDPQHHRDNDDRSEHELPVLAELNARASPERFHLQNIRRARAVDHLMRGGVW